MLPIISTTTKSTQLRNNIILVYWLQTWVYLSINLIWSKIESATKRNILIRQMYVVLKNKVSNIDNVTWHLTAAIVENKHHVLHLAHLSRYLIWVRAMGLNATFNNSSAISWRSVLLVGETRVPPICRKSLTNFII